MSEVTAYWITYDMTQGKTTTLNIPISGPYQPQEEGRAHLPKAKDLNAGAKLTMIVDFY